MLRVPVRRRASALVLLVVLLVGGFGLPVVDGLWFHSAAIAQMDRDSHVATPDHSGSAHMLGCAVWSSPVASSGLPELGPAPTHAIVVIHEPVVLPTDAVASQAVPTQALPRAPPAV